MAEAPPPSSRMPRTPTGLRAAEEALEAEEKLLLERAAVLEREVVRHRERQEAAQAARRRVEEQRAAEAELEVWESALKVEVQTTVERLNEQRASQIARCKHFEQTLQANVEAMQAMQAQVQRRATALDAAFDAAVGRLNGACSDAIAQRRAQAASAVDMPSLPAA
jgi:cell division septum initiation protein DivIVA